MKYIYPYGNCGRAIGAILEFFNEEYQEYSDDICDDGLMLIASYRYKYQLVNGLKASNEHNYIDGIEYAAKKLNNHLRNIIDVDNSVAIVLDDYKGQKHFGNICTELQKRNIKVYKFIYPDVLEYEKQDYDFVICQDMLRFIDCFKLIICTGINTHINNNSFCLRIPSHYYIFDYHAFYHDPKIRGFWAYKNVIASAGGGGILSISDSIRYERIREFYETHGADSATLLKLGYPGLDNAIYKYRNYVSNIDVSSKRDLIVFLSLPYSPFIESISYYIDIALGAGYRVLYKTHGGHLELLEKERQIVKKWQSNTNFIVCEDTLNDNYLFDSICIVEFRSSMLYTYPIITHKPALILQPDFEVYNEEDNFYCDKLHIKIYNKNDFLDTLDLLRSEEFVSKRKAMIEDYCKNDAYNIGCASEAISDFVADFLRH